MSKQQRYCFCPSQWLYLFSCKEGGVTHVVWDFCDCFLCVDNIAVNLNPQKGCRQSELSRYVGFNPNKKNRCR